MLNSIVKGEGDTVLVGETIGVSDGLCSFSADCSCPAGSAGYKLKLQQLQQAFLALSLFRLQRLLTRQAKVRRLPLLLHAAHS